MARQNLSWYSLPLPDARLLRCRWQNRGSTLLAVNAKNFDFIKEDPDVDRKFDLDVAGVYFVGSALPGTPSADPLHLTNSAEAVSCAGCGETVASLLQVWPFVETEKATF